jgi:prevent-host-death family protein
MVKTQEADMRTFSAADAKNRFGELLDAARREPVRIEKHGRPVAVMISQEDYEFSQQQRLRALREEIALGEADLDAGRYTEGDAFFTDLDRRIVTGDF